MARLFSAAQAREMWSAQTILPIDDEPPPLATLRPNFYAYGLGWSLRDYRGHKVVTHDGGLAGMTSRTILVPDLRLGLVMLTNAEEPAYAPLGYEPLDYFFGARRTEEVVEQLVSQGGVCRLLGVGEHHQPKPQVGDEDRP